jgi:hypothetical protein
MAEQQRCAIEFWVWLGKTVSDILQLIREAYGDDAMWRGEVFKWWKRFRDGEMNVKVEPLSGRPSRAPVPLSSWSLRQTVCSTFWRSGWSLVRSASLSKGGTSEKKKKTGTALPQSSDWSSKESPRTFQTATWLYLINKTMMGSERAVPGTTTVGLEAVV